MSASATLMAAAKAALASIGGLNGRFDGPPLKASLPYATIETGPESDWSWKGATGRELRLTAVIRDGGERPERLRALMDEVETRLTGIDGELGSWRVASCVFMQTRIAKAGRDWAGLVAFRVRMVRE